MSSSESGDFVMVDSDVHPTSVLSSFFYIKRLDAVVLSNVVIGIPFWNPDFNLRFYIKLNILKKTEKAKPEKHRNPNERENQKDNKYHEIRLGGSYSRLN